MTAAKIADTAIDIASGKAGNAALNGVSKFEAVSNAVDSAELASEIDDATQKLNASQ